MFIAQCLQTKLSFPRSNVHDNLHLPESAGYSVINFSEQIINILCHDQICTTQQFPLTQVLYIFSTGAL